MLQSIPRQMHRLHECINSSRPWRRRLAFVFCVAPFITAPSAIAAPTILNFEDIPAGAEIQAEYGHFGVRFPRKAHVERDLAAHSGAQVLRSVKTGAEFPPLAPLVITFRSPQTRVKLFAGSQYGSPNGTLTAFDSESGGNIVTSDGPHLVPQNTFSTAFQVAAPTASIKRVELQLEGTAWVSIDDLEFGVGPPVPTPTAPVPTPTASPSPSEPTLPPFPPHRPCPAEREVIDIPPHPECALECASEGDFDGDGIVDLQECLKCAVAKDNVIVRLAPDLDLDFSLKPAEFFPIRFGRCVTLTSVASFDTAPQISEARTPKSRGPVLRYGKHRDGAETFLEVRSYPDGAADDHVRISGFRLFGPSFDHQSTDEVGIRIMRCIDVEISNMEIAGWGGAGIMVIDDPGPDHASESNAPGGRIINPDQILIHDNFIHHNQHPSTGGHATGYGVETDAGAWAKIYQNVFDYNRHSIAASGNTGGYWAEHNVVLKGGGYHGRFLNRTTHSFDVHGTANCPETPWTHHIWNCGDAGIQFWYTGNAWQYTNGNDIKIRGRPLISAYIDNNVFPFKNRGDAISYRTSDNVHVDDIHAGENFPNVYKVDTFGHYGMGDFDGDGVDDLFLATGATWWFSSFGEFHWSYLNAKPEQLENLRFGYFDDDRRCDVLTEKNGQWMISSGGTSGWQPRGAFGPLTKEVQFGRFDPNERDHRPGVTRRTTHAFRRESDGRWSVTPLSHPDWQVVGSSSFPMSELQFGDFTGDGVTDVLAVEEGHWAISESARGQWRQLNPTLSDPVANLFIANMDPDDNIDDILRLDRKVEELSVGWRVKLTWWRSRNGTDPWRKWKQYEFGCPPSGPSVNRDCVQPDKGYGNGYGFAGRFGAAPGGGTLVIDQTRLGHFYSEAEIAAGAAPDWTSLFPY